MSEKSAVPTFLSSQIVRRFVGRTRSCPKESRLTKRMEKQSLAARLRQLRRERRLTQEEAAAGIGVARPTYTGYETGQDPPGRETLKRLADFYGVTLDELYRGVAARPQPAELVEDPDESALLSLWRSLDEPGKRRFLLSLVRKGDGG